MVNFPHHWHKFDIKHNVCVRCKCIYKVIDNIGYTTQCLKYPDVKNIKLNDLVSGKVNNSIYQGYVTFISLRGINIKLCTKEELIKNYYNLKYCEGHSIFIKNRNILSIDS